MSTFLAVNDEKLSHSLGAASRRVILITPAVSESVVTALKNCLERTPKVSVTVVLDPGEDAYRVGYGDQKGLELLQKLAKNCHDLVLREQPGLRIGVLLADDDVLVWSPIPRAVEGERDTDEPNGIDLGSGISAVDSSTSSTSSFADIIQNAVGTDDSDAIPDQIGRNPLKPEKMEETIKELKENPPVPFDLALKTRVLSTKLQFVEFEVRGAVWTKREIKLSSILLNADLRKKLQDFFETRIKPFSLRGDVAIQVPTLVQGQVAYNIEGKQILSPMTQADIEKVWKDIRGHYLKQLPGFGWIIHRAEHEKFVSDVKAYETVLKAWVEGFKERTERDEKALVEDIVDVINRRMAASGSRDNLPKPHEIWTSVLAGIQNLRDTEPRVKLIFKEISWESTRDKEFTEALREALTEEELKGWFEEFVAVRQRNPA